MTEMIYLISNVGPTPCKCVSEGKALRMIGLRCVNSPVFPITCPLDILVQFLLEIFFELGTEIGRMKEDCMCEFAL